MNVRLISAIFALALPMAGFVATEVCGRLGVLPQLLPGDTALIAAPNEFTKDVLESKLRPQVVEALSRTLGRDVRIAVTVGFMIGIFLLISEWYFFAEFESRFNTVAIDYLIYPHEVFTNLRESYPLPLIGASCGLGGIALSLLVFLRWPPAWNETPRPRRFAGAAGYTGAPCASPSASPTASASPTKSSPCWPGTGSTSSPSRSDHRTCTSMRPGSMPARSTRWRRC